MEETPVSQPAKASWAPQPAPPPPAKQKKDVLSAEHRAEKYYDLFEENTRLRTYQDQMNRDIAQLQNKLQYVKDKLTKGNIQTDDALIDKNTELKEENKKL